MTKTILRKFFPSKFEKEFRQHLLHHKIDEIMVDVYIEAMFDGKFFVFLMKRLEHIKLKDNFGHGTEMLQQIFIEYDKEMIT